MTVEMPTAAPAYYATHSPITDAGGHTDLFDGLPRELPALVAIVLGLMLHPAAAAKMGIDLSPERRRELDLRYVLLMLERIQALDPRPLSAERPPERRLVGNCRDAAVLLCAMLRHQGRAARARAGFATYLAPAFFTDHWTCEHWEADRRRWVPVDPGFPPDPTLFGFDLLDVPPDRFLVAGRAWQMCRAGRADPSRFGLLEMPEKSGIGWVGSQLVRDLACLNKRELLCWDAWALGRTAFVGIADEEAVLLDRVASVTVEARNEDFGRIQALYREDPRLTAPTVI